MGKTTTARIFAKIINCMNPGEDMEPCGECESCKSFEQGRSYCIHELDAASNNSVDDIRSLTEKVMIPPQIGRYGVYIIDEVHMLSTAALNAFLKTLEEPPAHAIFILATTEKHKIIPTILSRCQVFDFNRISIPDIVLNLRTIAQKESVQIDDESMHVIAQKADGAMRDALTLFDQVVAFCGNTVDYASVIKNLNVLDYDYYFRLVDFALGGDFAQELVLFDQVLNKGFNALYFVGGFGNHLRNLLVCKQTVSGKLLEAAPAVQEKYIEQSKKCPLKFLFKALATVEKCESDYLRSNNQRLLVEFMLVRISQLQEQPLQQAAQMQQSTQVQQSAPQVQQQPVQPQQATPQQATPQQAQPQQPQQPSCHSEASPEPAEGRSEESKPQPQQAQPQQPVQPQPVQPQQPAQPQQTTQAQSVGGISINSLLNKQKQQQTPKQEKEQQLDFMNPAQNRPVNMELLTAAWQKMADEYEKRWPNLPKFISILRAAPIKLEQENTAVIFTVGNSDQKKWIETEVAAKIASYLRRELCNSNIKLFVRLQAPGDIAKQLYMPQEKEDYIKQNNPEFGQLKSDLGMELN